MNEDQPTTQGLGIPYDVFCQDCGYNLRGLTGNRCPECGHNLDIALSQKARIPWVHRDKIGTIRAYWKTVFWVGFKYKRFCEEINRPVDYRESQRFRWLTIVHAYVPIVLATLAYVVTANQSTRDDLTWDGQISIWWFFGVIAVAAFVSLIAVTGVPSYLFDARSLSVTQRNRAVALSYYCCGSLNWTPFLIAIGVASVMVIKTNPHLEMAGEGGSMLVFFATLAQIADWWTNLYRTARRVMPQQRGRTVAVALLTPVLWALSIVAAFLCLAIPATLSLLIIALTS